jgi:hypothetical protein
VSEVADEATVRLLIADYAAADAAGKLNVIGGGITALGHVPNTGQTAPFALAVWVSVPPKHYNVECSVEIVLEDSTGNPVSLPGPTGAAQVMRVGQAVRFEEPTSPPGIPRHTLRSRTQWVLAFATGLPLPVGQRYAWRVKIDHQTREDWIEEFVLPGPVPGPVIG